MKVLLGNLYFVDFSFLPIEISVSPVLSSIDSLKGGMCLKSSSECDQEPDQFHGKDAAGSFAWFFVVGA
jgi:hypothetical protein